MRTALDQRDMLLAAWRTNNRVTVFLVEHLPRRNLPLDVGHVLTYFVAHEGHHRGQLVMLARQLGYRLPVEITGGLWQFSKRASEARS